MEGAELELERRSKFLSSLIQKKKAVEQQDHHDQLNVRVRASDMPIPLQNRAFRSARDHLDSMPGKKLDSKRLALALKKEFDSTYGPAWHCIVGTSFGSYVTHSTGGFLYFSIDKCYLRLNKDKSFEIFSIYRLTRYNLHKLLFSVPISKPKLSPLSSQPSIISKTNLLQRPNSHILFINTFRFFPEIALLKPKNMEISEFTGHQEHEAIDCCQDKKAGQPHEGLFLILSYLPLFELLATSEVCRSLRDAVNKDVLSWLDIVVKAPLNLRLFDDVLMKITSKANGRLRTLALMNCLKITDDGLLRVVEQNPLINKLYLLGCTGLTPEGVIRAVKTLSEHHHGLKSLMINGICNMNKEHLETLGSYLHMNLSQQEQPGSWPLLFHEYMDSPTFRHDRGHAVIDVEVCPKCDEVRMVFDCPRRTCKRKIERSSTDCRGCNFCIPRCQECGGCVDSQEMEEAVCSDILCSDCWLQLPKCDFCNKPYCKQHAINGSSTLGSTGFVCDVCYAKFVVNLHYIAE